MHPVNLRNDKNSFLHRLKSISKEVVILWIQDIFPRESVVLLHLDEERLIVHPSDTGLALDADDIEVATWTSRTIVFPVMILTPPMDPG